MVVLGLLCVEVAGPPNQELIFFCGLVGKSFLWIVGCVRFAWEIEALLCWICYMVI